MWGLANSFTSGVTHGWRGSWHHGTIRRTYGGVCFASPGSAVVCQGDDRKWEVTT